MSLFIGDKFNEFRNNIIVQNALINSDGDEYILLNLEEIYYRYQNEHKLQTAIEYLAYHVCVGLGKYTRDMMREIFVNENIDLDIIVMIKKEEEDSVFCGVLISEKGECYEHPNILSVNLICTDKKCKIKSSVLLAAYLYMIKSSYYQHWGILELSENYLNIQGLCAYGKFGFRKSQMLQEEEGCFRDENLAMSVDIDRCFPNFEDIINVLLPKNPFKVKMDPIDLCELYNPSTFPISNDVEFDKKKLHYLKKIQTKLMFIYSQEHLLTYGKDSPRKEKKLPENLRNRNKFQKLFIEVFNSLPEKVPDKISPVHSKSPTKQSFLPSISIDPTSTKRRSSELNLPSIPENVSLTIPVHSKNVLKQRNLPPIHNKNALTKRRKDKKDSQLFTRYSRKPTLLSIHSR